MRENIHPMPVPKITGKVLFIGDSITDEGQYVSILNAYFCLHPADGPYEFHNLGVCSENASGLSEPAHPFPRPCIHHRLDRMLSQMKADWAVICYGINDGIYYPFDPKRFANYQQGMRELMDKLLAHGLSVCVMTPVPFDPQSFEGTLLPEDAGEFSYLTPYENYNEVMEQYANWILRELPKQAAIVVDLFHPMQKDRENMRKQDPAYVSGDGIHPNLHGHFVIAEALLEAGFDRHPDALEEELTGRHLWLFDQIRKRDSLTHSYDKEWIGHTNETKNLVLPITECKKQVEAINEQIPQYLQTNGKML